MKPITTAPIEQNNRLVDAFCNGLRSRDPEYAEAKALVFVARQLRNIKGGEK